MTRYALALAAPEKVTVPRVFVGNLHARDFVQLRALALASPCVWTKNHAVRLLKRKPLLFMIPRIVCHLRQAIWKAEIQFFSPCLFLPRSTVSTRGCAADTSLLLGAELNQGLDRAGRRMAGCAHSVSGFK
ncbi:unnamed protein product [Effrenium voratum]|nr:unnamed protein product [Effrenium voratum]